MEQLRAYTRNPLVTIAAGVIVGLLLGLLIGWVIWPVEWQNAGPSSLSQEWRVDYLRMAIRDFAATGNVAEAQDRYKGLGNTAQQTMQEIIQNKEEADQNAIIAFNDVVGGSGLAAGPSETTAAVEPGAAISSPYPGESLPGAATATPDGADAPKKTSSLLVIFLVCLVLLGVGGAAFWYFFLRNRFTGGTGEPTAAQQAIAARRSASVTDYSESGERPIAQFMASYQLGDDLFDDSFSIPPGSDEFLGECGVSISEHIGVGDPKKVTAFEVWLFDKDDIQTVTKVIMSSYAFNDQEMCQRLAVKGELVEALPNTEFELETQSLRMVARVNEMEYGESAMPGESYFNRFLLELAIFAK